MKVISGTLRGRVIKGYDIEGTRPTMDRVKESVFASIQGKLPGSVVLDLFAGSGNLGIEAISNGADRCYFVDNNRKCIKVIEENVRTFLIEKNAVVLNKDYDEAIKYLGDRDIKFDIIFVDPPYRYRIKNEVLGLIMQEELLNDGGIVVYEYQEEGVCDNLRYFEVLRDKKYGDKRVAIYQKV